MKKVALILVEYALQSGLSGIAVGRNKNWKQNVAMGRRMNQLFTFIPHEKLVCALRTKCARAGLSFFETEEAHTSITDHLAKEVMGPKPEAYRWLGLREPRGLFRSSVGTTLHADVNGCLGIGRKAGGEQWLDDIIKKLGASPGTRLVPRKIHMNGAPSGKDQQAGTCHKRHLSPRMWTRTQVTLVKAGLLPASKGGDLLSPHSHQSFPAAA